MHDQWIFPDPGETEVAGRLHRELSVSPFLARLLAKKGFADPEDAEAFLDPRLRSLGDPEALPNMSAAIDRIDQALRRNEKIVLYGDYDVDGVSALAILTRVIRAYGGRVDCFLPCRSDEGYGLSEAGLAKCAGGQVPPLLIAVDCGTNSTAEIAALQSRGIDVIVLDHHEPQHPLPECAALVNPKLGDSHHYLCSAGIAFKFAHALLKRVPMPDIDLKEYLDIVALASLADLVPLVDENRTLVRRGLKQMTATRWPGLAALMEVAGVRPPVNAGDVGFRLGPRINAAGRLGTAVDSLELLLTDDPMEARRLAASLDRQNRERQTVERLVADEAENWVATNVDPSVTASIVVGEDSWHQGVLGIVASRICKRWYRPTLVVGFDEAGVGKGSGRSIEGLSLVSALDRCSGYLDGFGGHEMAAGLNIQRSEFAKFRSAFEEIAQEMLSPAMLKRRIRLDMELPIDQLSEDLLEDQDRLEPFGMANPQPVLCARALAPFGEPRVLREKHFRFDVMAGRRKFQAIYFNGAVDEMPRPPWDVAFRLERNEYNGRTFPQMHVVAMRSAS